MSLFRIFKNITRNMIKSQEYTSSPPLFRNPAKHTIDMLFKSRQTQISQRGGFF